MYSRTGIIKDTGWPTKCICRNYTSPTGFGLCIENSTCKFIISTIYCRQSRICEAAERKFTSVNEHNCVQNSTSDSSSKGWRLLEYSIWQSPVCPAESLWRNGNFQTMIMWYVHICVIKSWESKWQRTTSWTGCQTQMYDRPRSKKKVSCKALLWMS